MLDGRSLEMEKVDLLQTYRVVVLSEKWRGEEEDEDRNSIRWTGAVWLCLQANHANFDHPSMTSPLPCHRSWYNDLIVIIITNVLSSLSYSLSKTRYMQSTLTICITTLIIINIIITITVMLAIITITIIIIIIFTIIIVWVTYKVSADVMMWWHVRRLTYDGCDESNETISAKWLRQCQK